MNCEASNKHDELHLATLKLSELSPPTIQNLMKEINSTSEKLIMSGVPVDDRKKLSTLKRAVKRDPKYAITYEFFCAMLDLSFVKACSILMPVKREKRENSDSKPEEKKEEVNVNLHTSPTQQVSNSIQHTNPPPNNLHRCDQPGHAHFNCPL